MLSTKFLLSHTSKNCSRFYLNSIHNSRFSCRHIRNFTEQVSTGTNRKSQRSVAATIFFGSICLVTASLGYWQTGRYHWKKELIENTKQKVREPALDATSPESCNFIISNAADYRGRRLIVEGVFDHSKEILLGPRSSPVGMFGPAAQGLATNPQGFFVITPFVMSSGKVAFVNRGWVPRTAASWSRPAEKMEILVILTEEEKKNTFSPQNDPKNRRIFWLEREALLEAAGIQNNQDNIIILDTVGIEGLAPPTGGPYPKPIDLVHEHYVQPETHLSYAFTWFSLTAIGAYLTFTKFKPRKIVRK